MSQWLIVAFPGAFLVNEEKGVVAKTIFGGDQPDVNKAVEALLQIEEGKVPKEILEMLEKSNVKELVVDSEVILSAVSALLSEDVKVILNDDPEKLYKIREFVSLEIERIFGSREAYSAFASRVGISLTQAKIMEEGEKRDQMIIKAVTIQEDLTKMFNILVSHIREWYGFYFHELGKVVEDHELYLKLILELGRIENFTEDNLNGLINDKKLIKGILEAKEKAVPIKITEEDLERIKAICRLALKIEEERRNIMKYLDDLMSEAAPNIKSLVGPVIGAKLIRKAGGLEQLAKMPASTIQILGAEKALFRSLHGRGTPPKHGIIFQDPRIFKSPRWQRGKIARALASKLAIAARVDYFTGEYIGDELLASLERRIKEIKAKYPKPPVKKPVPKAEKRKKRRKERKGKRRR